MRRWTRRPKPLSSRSSRYLPRRSTATTRSPSSSSATSKRSCGRVRRGSRISTRASVRPSSRGASCARIVSTSGSSGMRLLDDVEEDPVHGRRLVADLVRAERPPRRRGRPTPRRARGRPRGPARPRPVWPRFALQTMPTEWSIASSFVRRPPPSSRLAMPIGSAASRVTTPPRGARDLVDDGRARERVEVGIAALRPDPALVRLARRAVRHRLLARARVPRRRRCRGRRARAAARTRRGRAR